MFAFHLDKYLGVGFLGRKNESLTSSETANLFLKAAIHSHQLYIQIPVSANPGQYLVMSVSLITPILVGVQSSGISLWVLTFI